MTFGTPLPGWLIAAGAAAIAALRTALAARLVARLASAVGRTVALRQPPGLVERAIVLALEPANLRARLRIGGGIGPAAVRLAGFGRLHRALDRIAQRRLRRFGTLAGLTQPGELIGEPRRIASAALAAHPLGRPRQRVRRTTGAIRRLAGRPVGAAGTAAHGVGGLAHVLGRLAAGQLGAGARGGARRRVAGLGLVHLRQLLLERLGTRRQRFLLLREPAIALGRRPATAGAIARAGALRSALSGRGGWRSGGAAAGLLARGVGEPLLRFGEEPRLELHFTEPAASIVGDRFAAEPPFELA